MSELDLSPPEVPEATLLESLLRYGLFLGALLQLLCILAVIMPTSKGQEQCVQSFTAPVDVTVLDWWRNGVEVTWRESPPSCSVHQSICFYIHEVEQTKCTAQGKARELGCSLVAQEEVDPSGGRAAEYMIMKKPKGAPPQIRQKLKKESKKKR